MPSDTWQNLSDEFDKRIQFLKSALKESVTKVLAEDTDLIAAGAHEQAITHRTAVYLEQILPEREKFTPDKLSDSRISVDAEYNRSGGETKTFAPTVGKIPKWFRPDIVVHSRLFAGHNYLAVEAKLLGRSEKWKELWREDKKKIENLVCEGPYHYNLGAMLTICSPKWYIRKKRHAAITIQWFTKAERWSKKETCTHDMSADLLEVAMRRGR